MKNTSVIIAVLSFVASIFVAAFIGAGLAMWDQNMGVNDVVEYVSKSNEDVVLDTHKIVNSSTDIIIKYTTPDYNAPVISSSSAKISPMVSMPEPIKAKALELAANEVNEEESQEDSSEVEPEEAVEENSEEDNEDELEEEIIITSEVAGIPELVKAGSEEVIVNSNLIPESQLAEGEYRDPIETFPLDFTEVPESYFDDALFIGDSRVQGLGMYSGTNATFFAATAFQLFEYKTFKVVPTSNGKVPIFDVMPYDAFTKVYIKVGLNELGCVSEEKFISVYQELLDQVRMMQPRAIVYIQAVFPVTAAKSSTDGTHNNPKIAARNESIKAFAAANNCYYIDASAPFVDETGALRSETTADGIHMYARFMPEWIEYLRTHAVPWP